MDVKWVEFCWLDLSILNSLQNSFPEYLQILVCDTPLVLPIGNTLLGISQSENPPIGRLLAQPPWIT